MKKNLSALTLFFCLVFANSSFAVNPCAEALLGPQRIDILYKATQSDYEVSVLSGQVEGKDRLVVILGEAHVKDPQAYALGAEILKHFSFRGLEGVKFSKYWGGKALAVSVEVGYQIANLLSFGKRSRGSTIHLARRQTQQSDQYDQMAQELTQLRDEGTITTEQFEKILGLMDPKFLEKLQMAINNVYSPPLPTVTNIPLEEGHQPRLVEQLASITPPGLLLACVGLVCSAAFDHLSPDNQITQVSIPALSFFIYFGTFQQLGTLVFSHWQHTELHKKVFALGRGLIDGRDETMTKNIVRAFTEHPDEQVMLVIVGSLHVPGIEKHLIKQHGFESQSDVLTENLPQQAATDPLP